ncbi:MAG: RNA polymerase sigma factor [Oscillospiraceae bacterium]|nr:RNA polymerase sigma factor [Oscillospiraceae bacterium]
MSDFEKIYEQYGKRVYYFLLSLCRDEDLAEELTQETMLRAIMNIGSFRKESKLSTWLCQIAKNLYFEWQKKSRRTVPLDENASLADCGEDIEERLSDKEDAQRILRRLHLLGEPYKEVFTLHALGGVSLTEISKLFGKSDSWARVTYYRAKAMIISSMEEKDT